VPTCNVFNFRLNEFNFRYICNDPSTSPIIQMVKREGIEIAASLTPGQRLARLNEMIRFNKQFSPNYRKAFERRLYQDNDE